MKDKYLIDLYICLYSIHLYRIDGWLHSGSLSPLVGGQLLLPPQRNKTRETVRPAKIIFVFSLFIMRGQDQREETRASAWQRKNAMVTSWSLNEPRKDMENMCAMRGEKKWEGGGGSVMIHIWLKREWRVQDVIWNRNWSLCNHFCHWLWCAADFTPVQLISANWW